jgi:hypothetical protein
MLRVIGAGMPRTGTTSMKAALEQLGFGPCYHTEMVKAGVPADRLLIFDVREGWQPLCEFLGVPVPDEPFPHLNDTHWVRRAFEYLREHGQMPSPFAG